MNFHSLESTSNRRSKKWMKQGSKYTVAVIAGAILIVFVGGPYLAYRTWDKMDRYFREKRRSLQFREEDPPSQALGTILRLGGSCSNPSPAPKRQGCVVYGSVSLLICGEMDMDLKPAVAAETCFLTDLMRSNRMIYRDMLHHFYARNLFSFFGPEMLLYFVRNVNPEGLRLIRYVHLAIPLQSEGWESKESQALVTKAFEVLQEQFESVKQLDVEVVILRSQPADPELLAAWLRDKVFGQLHGLEKLIVKVSVHKGLAVHEERSSPYGPPVMEALSSWTEPLYKTVKDAATSGPKE